MKINKKTIIIILIALMILIGGIFLYIRRNSKVITNNISDPETTQRQSCHDSYDKLFSNAKEVNDPLNYDKTNPDLYKCLMKLKNPLGI